MQAKFFTLLCCSLVLGCSAGCKSARNVAHLKGEIYLAPTLSADTNQNAPIAVDVVTVHGAALLKQVSALTAQVWFEQKVQLLRLHPDDLQDFSWEWTPGEPVAAVKVPATGVADGVLLFANYLTPGPHSAVLPRSGTVPVTFGPNDFQVPSKQAGSAGK